MVVLESDGVEDGEGLDVSVVVILLLCTTITVTESARVLTPVAVG